MRALDGFTHPTNRSAGCSVLPRHLIRHNNKRQRYLKMSVGENPKGRVYPNTRLSEAAIFREYYAKASTLRAAQVTWCMARTFESDYPEDAVLQPLVDVLRGDMQVHVHGYKTEDLEVSRTSGIKG